MKYILLPVILALGACASTDTRFLDAQVKAAASYADAQKAIAESRAKSVATIASSGASDASKAMGLMALMSQSQNQPGPLQIQPPPTNEALQWASILVPGLTQIAGMRYQFLSSQAQSNNARDVAISTNGTFGGLGASIAASGANGLTAVSSTAAAGFTALGASAALIQTPAPNITLSGTGTIGGGSFSSVDTHAVDSHNTDSHNADRHDTVTPAPVVVTPVPVIVTPVITPTVP